jgi:MFS transporter, MHS family, proline/betaine transporter
MTAAMSEKKPRPPGYRRVVAAALAGSFIEFYEFGIYSVLAPVLAPQFFPDFSKTAQLLATFLLFGIAFVIRPLGGIFLGRLGDSRGRKDVLMVTIIGCGVATAAIGILPTYAGVGVWAPVLLLCARLVQGFFLGGENIGASTYVAESVPKSKRGFYGASTPTGIAMGLGGASLVSGIISALITKQQMVDWGWRIPFLLSIPLVVIAVMIRRNLEESQEFEELSKSGKAVHAPVREVLVNHKAALLKILFVGYGVNVGYWVGITFMSTYLISYQNYNPTDVLALVAAVTVVHGLTMPFWGALSDRIGRRAVLAAAFVGYAVLALPMMMLMSKGDYLLAAVGLFVLAIPFPMAQSVAYPTYTEQFPTGVRFTGLAVAYNLATILGAGMSPYLATLLISTTGWNLAPAALLMGASILALGTLPFLTDVSQGRSVEVAQAPRELASR